MLNRGEFDQELLRDLETISRKEIAKRVHHDPLRLYRVLHLSLYVLNDVVHPAHRYNIEDKWNRFLEVTQWKPKQ